MALKLDYVLRETSTNIRRNVTLTIAAIVTMGVSLSLFGSAMLMRAGVANLSTRWERDVQLIAFLERDLSDEQRSSIQESIEENPGVREVTYMNQEESNAEFERLFRRNQAMLQRATENPNLVPTSFRIAPNTSNEDAIRQMGAEFQEIEGVLRTTSALDSVRMVRQVSSSAQKAIFVIAVGLLLAALLLILNAIRMAIFARRREIEVMKLVGATNWFIRVPFMLEGVVQGVIGSTMAVVSVFFLDRFMERYGTDPTNILSGFVASSGEAFFVMVMVVVIGIVIGAAGSGWAVSRFLKV